MNFKINSRPLFTIIFKLKNYNFKTRDFSPFIERVLAGVIGIKNELEYETLLTVEDPIFSGQLESTT